MSATVWEVLQKKTEQGASVLSVTPQSTVFDALKLMADKEIGALLVLDGTRLAGIFSERDYARKVVLMGKASKDTTVAEIMTERVLYVRPENTMDDCMQLMTGKRIRHLPVLGDGDRVLGIISIGDVVKAMIAEQKQIIEQLESYIHQ
jgi:CBS domain-containing protein